VGEVTEIQVDSEEAAAATSCRRLSRTNDQTQNGVSHMASQTASAIPTNLVEAVMLLNSIATPAAEIARRMHVDQATVLHALKHGTLPVRQLSMLWIDEPQASPYEQETRR
jgi:hypothetical protein